MSFEHFIEKHRLDRAYYLRLKKGISASFPLLTAYEISKSYRVCLDARNLNNLTADEIVCSPNPDTMISELMFMNSDQSNLETNADLISNVPEELLKYLNCPLDESEEIKKNKEAFKWLKTFNNETNIAYSMTLTFGLKEKKTDAWNPYWIILLFNSETNIIGDLYYAP